MLGYLVLRLRTSLCSASALPLYLCYCASSALPPVLDLSTVPPLLCRSACASTVLPTLHMPSTCAPRACSPYALFTVLPVRAPSSFYSTLGTRVPLSED